MEGTAPADAPVRRRPRRRWIILAMIVGLLVIIVGLAFVLPVHPAGSEMRITLNQNATRVWVDESPSLVRWLRSGGTSSDVWCFEQGDPFADPTGEWDDGIAHGGLQTTGTVRFESDDVAVFRSDAATDGAIVVLRRDADPRRFCD